MRDFGECLVQVRERLDEPLPVRVHRSQVFIAALLEAFSIVAIRAAQPRYRSAADDRYGLPDSNADLKIVEHEFSILHNMPASEIQIEQAHTAFREEVERRCERSLYESNLWHGAIVSGAFLGSLLVTLISTSFLMCVITGRITLLLLVLLGTFLAQAIVGLVCLRGWHRL